MKIIKHSLAIGGSIVCLLALFIACGLTNQPEDSHPVEKNSSSASHSAAQTVYQATLSLIAEHQTIGNILSNSGSIAATAQFAEEQQVNKKTFTPASVNLYEISTGKLLHKLSN